MRILYISQYFPPEAGATQTRAYEMAHNWVMLGHKVTMLTEFPNHPTGIIPSEYRGKIIEKSFLDGIEVIRVWVKASPEKTFLNRMLFYLSFMFSAIIAGILHTNEKYDLLYATSPPLFVGGAALILSHQKRIPLVFEIRDLWPESAIALGELNNPRAISLATKLEERCYQKAFQIVAVTHGIYDRLIERGISPAKIILIPNGSNTDLFTYNIPDRERIRNELGFKGKFIAIYAGIHGLAQGLETIVETAYLLRDSPEIQFLLIGDGPKKKTVMSLARSYELTNVTFLPEMPRDQIPGYLSAADIALVPLRKIDIFKSALPSKIFDAWACERPVLHSIDGEARRMIDTIKGGIYIPPEDPPKMAEVILMLTNIRDELDLMGKNGRDYTVHNHSRKTLAEKLITHLSKTTSL